MVSDTSLKTELAAVESLSSIVDRFTANLSREFTSRDAALSPTELANIQKSIDAVLLMATGLAAAQRVMLLPAMDRYLRFPSSETWRDVYFTAGEFLVSINQFVDDIARIHRDYALQPEYRELFASVFSRSFSLGTILAQSKPPDVAEFAELRDRYRSLIARLEDATTKLASYEKNKREFEQRQRESTQEQRDRREFDYRIAKGQHAIFLTIAILVVLAGVAFAGAGVWLVVGAGEKGATEMTLFGQTLKTSSVGVAAIFIGAITIALTLRRILKTLGSSR